MSADEQVTANFVATMPAAVGFDPPAFNVVSGRVPITESLQLWNSGGGTLNYRISADVPWVSIFPSAGVSIGQTNTHSIVLNTAAVSNGVSLGNLTINPTDGAASPQSVPISLSIESLVPPVQWQISLGGSGWEELSSVQQTTDGGYIIGGSSGLGSGTGNKSSPSFGVWDFWIARLDAGGNKLWDQSFGGLDDDKLGTVRQTTDGGF